MGLQADKSMLNPQVFIIQQSKASIMDRQKAGRISLKGVGWWMMLLCVAMPAWGADDVEHKYADNNGVKIHYVAMGEGPLVVFIHGFPDFWYSWWH